MRFFTIQIKKILCVLPFWSRPAAVILIRPLVKLPIAFESSNPLNADISINLEIFSFFHFVYQQPAHKRRFLKELNSIHAPRLTPKGSAGSLVFATSNLSPLRKEARPQSWRCAHAKCFSFILYRKDKINYYSDQDKGEHRQRTVDE